MPHYLVQAAYTPEAWTAMTKNPTNRAEAVGRVVEGLGGRIESAYLSFGEFDVMVLAEFPDNISAAAFAMASAGKGHLKVLKTTPLLTVEEGLQAMSTGGTLDIVTPG
jgi:uncharacterized protein with GYD domain